MLVEDWLGCEARTRTCIRTEAGWLLAKVSTLREIRKRFVLRFGKRHSSLFFQKKGINGKGTMHHPPYRRSFSWRMTAPLLSALVRRLHSRLAITLSSLLIA